MINYKEIKDQMEQTFEVCRYVSERLFPILYDLNVLEMGPFNGWWTQEILKYTDQVTVIEKAAGVPRLLLSKFGDKIKIIDADFHSAVMDCGRFDVVLLLGILYHSVSPIKLIEDTVNFCCPRFIILDSPRHSTTNTIVWDTETTNEKGSRQNPQRSSGIVFRPDEKIIHTALQNLGFYLNEEICINETPLSEMPGLNFKNGLVISVWSNGLDSNQR